ncbi:MAG: DUF58 domain-containing protein [Chloroflexi bacterium]|nr:DUF58 domain-containing protein [Chloroflexota bacterium]
MSRHAARAGLGGEHRSRRPSPSTDFVDYRPYHPGDDFRRVDWNVYGRLGTLQVKVTEGRERLNVLFVLDCSGSMAWGGAHDKLKFAVQLVASLGYVALSRADQVRVSLLGADSSGALKGRGRTGELVRFLSSVVPTGQVDLNGRLGDVVPSSPNQALVVVVSDLLVADGVAASWDALLGFDAVVVHVVAPEEMEPRLTGEAELVDAETGEVMHIGASLETLSAYRTRFAEWLDQQRTECERREMRYVRVRTDRPLEQVMLEDLRGAGVLR